MAEQASGTVQGTGTAGTLAHAATESHHGKPVSWVAIAIIVAGFVIGAISMVPHPTWWLFWTGAGIALIGCIMTLFAKTFDDWY